jgi:hypothetical protein
MLIGSPLVRRDRTVHSHRNVLHSLGAGLSDVWRDRTLRLYFVLIGAVNLALLGPLSVGVPVLAHTRFSGGVFSYVVLGIGLSLLGALPSAGLAVVSTFLIGMAEGYLIVVFITWVQIRTSREQLGRMMSILMLISLGQAPLSNLIAAGSLIVLVAATAALSPSVWKISENCVVPERTA